MTMQEPFLQVLRGSAEDIHPADLQRTDRDVERTQMTGSVKMLKRLRSADLGLKRSLETLLEPERLHYSSLHFP